MVADEFFRPSYTSGIWATGNITKGLQYQVMLGNNLSTLGVSSGQLNNKIDTLSSCAHLDAEHGRIRARLWRL